MRRHNLYVAGLLPGVLTLERAWHAWLLAILHDWQQSPDYTVWQLNSWLAQTGLPLAVAAVAGRWATQLAVAAVVGCRGTQLAVAGGCATQLAVAGVAGGWAKQLAVAAVAGGWGTQLAVAAVAGSRRMLAEQTETYS